MSVPSLARSPTPEQATLHPRQYATAGEGNSCWSTAMKIAMYVAGAIAAVCAFIFLGPVVGIVSALALGGLALLFSRCCDGNSHRHAAGSGSWSQRVLSQIPTSWIPASRTVPMGSHVPVGGGHIHSSGPMPAPAPHVPVGRGHIHVTPGPGRVPMPGPAAAPHVPVGRGHTHVTPGPGRVPMPGPAAAPHVPVGRGHSHVTPGPGRNGPLPPSGPANHVRVGRR